MPCWGSLGFRHRALVKRKLHKVIRTCLTRGLVVLGLWVGGAAAQDAPRITGHVIETNPAYERRVLLNRLQTELVYVDRLNGEIPLDGAPPPPDKPRDDSATEVSDTLQMVTRLALLLLIGMTAAMLYRNRGWLAERLGALPDARRPRVARKSPSDDAPPVIDGAFLARLRAMTDRRAALVDLLGAALSAAAEQNGMRLGRSETARDLLRRLPDRWPHLPALRALVMTEELVQFGGRPLPEATFEDCLSTAAPILSRPGASG